MSEARDKKIADLKAMLNMIETPPTKEDVEALTVEDVKKKLHVLARVYAMAEDLGCLYGMLLNELDPQALAEMSGIKKTQKPTFGDNDDPSTSRFI